MSKMTVFHGSNQEIKIPKIIKGRYTKDFGCGFYCTNLREQAERWARRYTNPIVNKYTVKLNEKLSILEFKNLSDKWLEFIIECRNGRTHSFDIVIGAMANDQVYNYISDYIDGSLTKEQFWALAKFKYPTHQINFCTQKALQSLDFISSYGVTDGR